MVHHVVVVAGWDPSGGGGLIRDLRTLRDLKVHASGVVAALTTQDASGRGRVEPVSSHVVLDQLNSASHSKGPFVLKIGMVYSRANIEALAAWIDRHKPVAVVLDPVLESKGGLKLATRDAVAAYPRLIRQATVLTPNLAEARSLVTPENRRARTGPRVAAPAFHDRSSRRPRSEAEGAALLLHRLGAAHILLKLPASRRSKIDLHFNGSQYVEHENRRPRPYEVRGSGCTLASAVAAFIARGLPPDRAIPRAIEFVRTRFSKTVVTNGVRLFA